MELSKNKVLIVGGGPAGLTAALYLEKLNVPYVLLEKKEFPKDKICGDAFTPIILQLLGELDLEHSFERVKVTRLNVKFNYDGIAESITSDFDPEVGVFNTKRINFDNFLYQNIKDKESLHFNTKVTSVNYQNKSIIMVKENIKKEMFFDRLIIATGSKRIIFNNENKYDFNFATRLYIKVNDVLNHNYIEYLSDFDFGYFWAFPVSKNELNTGVYFKYNETDFKNKYDIHLKKIAELFKCEEPVDESQITVWPLKVFQPIAETEEYNRFSDIQIIGDANYSIDPFLGHGIDVAMLEAREVALKISENKSFDEKSVIENLIIDKNSKSLEFQNSFTTSKGLTEKVDNYKKYLTEISHFYSVMNQLVSIENRV
jgi:flavin-dependent dehydrogenase